jgi:TatD DNase family protein
VLFDTHAHLHFPEFAPDLSAVPERARAAGVRWILTIGTRHGPRSAFDSAPTAASC